MIEPKSWHIELTSRCVLECPGCDRTWFKKTFKKQIIQDISIDDLLNFFDRNNFLSSEINLCGNNGDPIYHPKFLEILKQLKKQNHKIKIATNGSAKTEKFWTQVGDITDKQDTITFGIDGLDDTNHLYRKNSNWDQVMTGVRILKDRPIKKIWQYIPFKQNLSQIYKAKKLSKYLGFDQFLLMPSDRWMEENMQDMKPDSHIDIESFIQKTQLSGNKMKPQCLTNERIYIDSDGTVYPCCWAGTYRYKFKTPFGHKKHNISNLVWNDIFQPEIKTFLQNTTSYEKAHEVCKMNCGS